MVELFDLILSYKSHLDATTKESLIRRILDYVRTYPDAIDIMHGVYQQHRALTLVARMNNLDLCRLLVQESFVHIEQTTVDTYRDTAFSWFAYQGNVEACEFLYRHGANINFVDANQRHSAIMWAVMRGHINILYWALRKLDFDVFYLHPDSDYSLIKVLFHNSTYDLFNVPSLVRKCVHLLLKRGLRDLEYEYELYACHTSVWNQTFGNYFYGLLRQVVRMCHVDHMAPQDARELLKDIAQLWHVRFGDNGELYMVSSRVDQGAYE